MTVRANPNRKQQVVFMGALLLFVLVGLGVYFAKKRQMSEPPPPARLTSHVMDEANIIWPDERARMNATLEALEAAGGPQIVVATEKRIEGATIAEDALARARRWGVGAAGRNDGAVLLIAQAERKARIEVGYGLEGVLTDAASRLIIESRIAPHLAAGAWTDAARDGLDGVLAIVHPGPVEPPKPSRLYEFGQLAGVALFGVVIALIVVGVVQAIVLAIPGARRRIARSRRWGWFARVRILGGSRDDDRRSSDASPSSIGGGGSFGGGGAND